MPYDGSGNFVRSFPPGGWQGDATGGIKILASRHDQHDNDIAAALSLALTRDGQSMPTADINWNGKKIINLAAPIAGTDAANKAYVDGIRNFSTPIVITGSHPNSLLKFTGTTGPWGDSYVTADLSYGVRGAAWVWNDKADFSGDDLMTLAPTAALTIKAPALANPSFIVNKFASGQNAYVMGQMGGKFRWIVALGDSSAEAADNSGSDFAIYRYANDGTYLGAALSIDRPSGAVTIPGAVTISGQVTTSTRFYSATGVFAGYTTTAILGTNQGGAGIVYLRPNGYDVGTGQTYVQADGKMVVAASVAISAMNIHNVNATSAITFSGGSGPSLGAAISMYGQSHATLSGNMYYDADLHTFRNSASAGSPLTFDPSTGVAIFNSITGSVNGQQMGGAGGGIVGKRSVSTVATQILFQNPSGNAGTISSSNLTTAYGTTSDENFKELDGEMDTAQAIAIIRADPVLAFHWRKNGEPAIGWFAQKSYAVNPDLAVPPEPPSDEAVATPLPGEDGYQPWGIDYGRRTPYLWAALTWALDQIDQLNAKMAILDPKPA